MARARTTTEKGLGWEHRQQRERLMQAHVDGTLCWWCGLPMFKSQGLHADHSLSRAFGGTKADRLLHGPCNRDRGDGSRDHLRPAVTGRSIKDAQASDEALGYRAMAWP